MNRKITTNPKHLAYNPGADVLKIKTERNSLGTIKTMIVLLLLLIQLATFILTFLYFVIFFRVFSVISYILSLITCLYVLSSNKNSQSKPIWILFLLICSSFGWLVYLISDEKIFWHKHKKRYNKILENSNKYVNQLDLNLVNKTNLAECNYLMTAGNFSAYNGTKSLYFPSGTKFFDGIIEDIKKAQKFIFIEFFIISDGNLLNRIINILQEKVKQGVDIRIIYDDFGSSKSFSRKTKKLIKRSNIKLVSFNNLLSGFSMLLNYRDHRKIVIIDGKVAYTGGANLADEYTNEKRLYGYWKDSGIRLEGDAVNGLSLMFLRQWEFTTNKKEDYSKYINLNDSFENNSIFVPYADGLEYEDNIGKNAYTNLISNANEKLYIMSPYFVIDDTITNLLINKAKAGVDVRIILPDIADKKIVYVISRNTAEKLTKFGIKLYTMKNSFVHSKVMLTENSAIVGSINMDLRSFYQQFESSVYLNDKQTLLDIEKDFENSFNISTFIEDKNLKRNKLSFKLFASIINLISPFM